MALAGVSLALVTGEERWDAIGSIGIGLLLVVIAITLAIEMKSLLIGESASPGTDTAIRSAMTSGPEIIRVIHLRTQHLGPDELLVAAKAEFAVGTVEELAAAIDTVEARVRAAVPIARMIYLEPDVYRADANREAGSG
jgi:divalent metal cation (Fe/Co/Zn/Cd) transporter